MRRLTVSERVAEWYAEFKASPYALGVTLATFFLITLGHSLWGWDNGYENTLYFLSWEATIASCLLVADIARSEAHRRRQDKHAREQAEAMLTILKAIREALVGDGD